MKHTIGLPNELWRVLSDASLKRNLAEYEGDLEGVDEEFVEAMLRATREAERRVMELAEKTLPA